MTLKVRVHQGRLGTEQYRVVRPANPVTAALLGYNPWFVLGTQRRRRVDVLFAMLRDKVPYQHRPVTAPTSPA